jgi:hypothetical protein
MVAYSYPQFEDPILSGRKRRRWLGLAVRCRIEWIGAGTFIDEGRSARCQTAQSFRSRNSPSDVWLSPEIATRNVKHDSLGFRFGVLRCRDS